MAQPNTMLATVTKLSLRDAYAMQNKLYVHIKKLEKLENALAKDKFKVGDKVSFIEIKHSTTITHSGVLAKLNSVNGRVTCGKRQWSVPYRKLFYTENGV